jgi:hypothetical protein
MPLISQTRPDVQDFGKWNIQMGLLLGTLTRALTETVEAWTEFQRKQIGYFDDDESIDTVDNAFSDLRGLLQKLQNLTKQCCEDNPRIVSHIFIEIDWSWVSNEK